MFGEGVDRGCSVQFQKVVLIIVNHREDEVPAPKRAKGKTPGWGCFLCGGKNMPVEDED